MERKSSLTRTRLFLKSCFHLGLKAPAVSFDSFGEIVSLFLVFFVFFSNMQTLTVEAESKSVAKQRNGGKHVALDDSARVTIRPSGDLREYKHDEDDQN